MNPARDIDRICDEFKAAWQAGEVPKVEEFVARIDEEHRPALREALMPLDLTYRGRLNETLDSGIAAGRGQTTSFTTTSELQPLHLHGSMSFSDSTILSGSDLSPPSAARRNLAVFFIPLRFILIFVVLFGLATVVSTVTAVSKGESRVLVSIGLVAFLLVFAIYRWLSGRHQAGSVLLSLAHSGSERIKSFLFPLFLFGYFVFATYVAPVMDGQSFEEVVAENLFGTCLFFVVFAGFAPEILCSFATVQFREHGIRNGALIRWDQIESYYFSSERRYLKLYANRILFPTWSETQVWMPASQQALLDSGAVKQLLLERLPGKSLQQDPDQASARVRDKPRELLLFLVIPMIVVLVLALIFYLVP